MDLAALIKELRTRPSLPATGAHVALDYLLTIDPILKGKDVVTEFGIIGSTLDWAKSLTDAASKLVWVEHNLDVSGLEKAKSDEKYVAEATPLAIFDGVTVLTSKSKDRDRDVMHPDGCELDVKMPWLWQHIPGAPIGKYVATVVQNSNLLKVHFALADTPLGRDAATLLEFKALRTSHGFIPKEWKELPSDKDGTPNGYEILKYHTYEGSSVSIPSNTDAEMTAMSRAKFHTPLVKSHAAALLAKRPDSVTVPASIDDVARPASGVTVNVNLGDTLQKGMGYVDMFPGSWGATEAELEDKLPNHLRVNGVDVRQYDMVRVRAMYPNYAIVVHYKTGDAGWSEELYRCGWTGNGDQLAWKGEPKPLEMKVEFVEKQKELALFQRKQSLRVANPDDLGRMLLGKLLAAQGELSVGVAAALHDALGESREKHRRTEEAKAWDALSEALQ